MNTTENKSFYGLVSSGELNAVFTVMDQDLSDSLQITTLKENRPKTGQKIQVGEKTFTVKQIQDRINSPLIRIFVEK